MKFEFSKPVLYIPYQSHDFTEVQLAQFAIAMEKVTGHEEIEKSILFCEEEAFLPWEYCQVSNLETGEIDFDCWMISHENGTFFIHNSEEEAGMEIIQMSTCAMFEETDDLEEPLNIAYRKVEHFSLDIDEYMQIKKKYEALK